MSIIKPHDYQKDAINAFKKAQTQGIQRGIINLPTGTGKTITGLLHGRQLSGRMLWMAHREELITQPERALSLVWPEATSGVVKADRNEFDAQVVFASVQSLSRPNRLERLEKERFDLIVVDEAHHAAAKSYMDILHHARAFEVGGPPTMGLTATIERGDGQCIGTAFQDVVYQMQLLDAIRNGYLVDIRTERVTLDIDLDNLPTSNGDYQHGALEDAMLRANVAEATADAYIEYGENRKALLFTVSVDQAQRTAEALTSRGIPAEWVSGETHPDERAAIIQRLKTGETRVVANCAVFTEGFDEPSVEVVVLARPTQSKSLFLQMIGRGTRKYPGKEDCLIIDISGATEKHSLVQVPHIFGLNAETFYSEKKSILEATEQPEWYQELADMGAFSVEDEMLESFVRASQGKAYRFRAKWVQVEPDLFVVNAGEAGTVAIIGLGGDDWIVEAIPKERNKPNTPLTPKPVWLDLAQGIGEDYVRRANAVGLAKKSTRWRSQPASPKQLEALKKWGITLPNLAPTAGEVSDAITGAIAKSRTRKLRTRGRRRVVL